MNVIQQREEQGWKVKRVRPFFPGAAVGLLVFSSFLIIERLESRRYLEEVELRTLQQLSAVRAVAENAINKRVFLTLGLKAHVACFPDLTTEQFDCVASQIMLEGEGIRSVTLVPNNVIRDVYPREGNETAIGTDLLDHPEQGGAVERAIETRKPQLSGPVKIVQGGEAFIYRVPVFLSPLSAAVDDEHYWGLVSILIAKDQLVHEVIAGAPSELRFAIRRQTKDPELAGMIMGDNDLLNRRFLSLNVTLPSSTWEVIGRPKEGWPKYAPASPWLWPLGFFAAVVGGYLTTFAIESNRQLRRANRIATTANAEVARQNEGLEAFIRTAAHDLRAPLRHVKTLTLFVREDAGDRLQEEELRHLDVIDDTTTRMSVLLEDLLAFARAGTAALNKQQLQLSNLVAIVVRQLPAEQRSFVNVESDHPLFGDQSLLVLVLQNLIENALKYCEDNQVEVIINATRSDMTTTVSIRDNGIGLEAEQLTRIFNPGTRGVHANEYQGSGYGLATCQRIINAHGGRIWVESEIGQGATFYFTLPAD